MNKKNIKIKNKIKLEPLYSLDKNFTKVCNTMIKYIPNAHAFKVYCYLCYRYNRQYQYAFPSLTTIANETCMNRKTVQRAIKWLEDQKYVVKYKRKDSEWMNNCYYVRYVVEERIEETQHEIVESLEEIMGDELEKEIEIYVDEDGNIIED